MLDRYIRFRSNPDNDDKADTFFCTAVGTTLQILKKLKKENKSWSAKALKLRREVYSEKMMKVDSALFKAAQNGDTRAADLLYRRFDNWSPKQAELQVTNNFVNFSDLVKDIKGGTKPRDAVRVNNDDN